MRDAIGALPQGEAAAVRQVLPREFPWALFAGAWMMMFAPVAEMGWQLAKRWR